MLLMNAEPVKPRPLVVHGIASDYDDQEIDQLRIDAIRRCHAVTRSLEGLMEKPATLADIFSPEHAQRRILNSVDFDGAEAAKNAAARLEALLGPEGAVLDPRPMHSDVVTVAEIKEMVEHMDTMLAPYRAIRDKLKKGK